MSAQTISISPNYKYLDIHQISVTSTEQAFPAFTVDNPVKGRCESIFVQALSTNTGTITLNETGVVSGGAGIELPAGANAILPLNDRGFWYAIASSGTQKLNIIYQSGVN